MAGYPFGRRELLRSLAAAPIAAAGLHLAGGEAPASRVHAQISGGGVTADQALQELLAGNRNFVAGNLDSLDNIVARRGQVASSQSPIAVIVSCSDSRVPPELVFDQTLGEVFVVRTAGQVIDEAARSSIVYAVDFLKAPLVLVMGHSRCGAVEAAVAAIQGNTIPGYAFRLAEAIGPAVRRVQGQPGDLLDNAIRANVRLGVEQIRDSEPLLAEDVRQGRLTVVGAYYDFQTGQVTMLS
jgi:carbonic anhydrase